ncbi:MAG: hypothetical protein ACRDYC_07580, partial [Acidimicrobiales bacterium]
MRARPSTRSVVAGGTLILLTLGAILGHQGHLLRYLFPASALAAALLLYRRRPIAYISLVCWLWILTPEVRRISDYQAGYDSVNPIMIAPLLASVVCVISLLHGSSTLRRARLEGLGLVVAGLLVATLVGVALNGLSASVYALATWIVPPLFAAHLALQWRIYPSLRRSIFRLAAGTAAVVGGYGIYQFFRYPAWDNYWGDESGILEYFRVTARHFRTFSTLNSAVPNAFVLVILLLITFQF